MVKKLIPNFIKKFYRKFYPIEKIKRFVPIEKEFLGKTIYIHDIASFDLCFDELFVEEAYKFIAKSTTPNIVDCGANLGMSIIYFKELYPLAKIIAFEADEHIYKFLEKNVKSFGYSDVEIINKAVWNDDKDLKFLAEGGAGGRLENNDYENQIFKTVKSIRLKNYLKNNKVDFLKIDIEGAEYEVIMDCAEEIKNIDFLFIEYHSMIDRKQNLHEILGVVHNAGFRYHIKQAYTTKYPYIERTLNFGMDLQLNIFCYKEIGRASCRERV